MTGPVENTVRFQKATTQFRDGKKRHNKKKEKKKKKEEDKEEEEEET